MQIHFKNLFVVAILAVFFSGCATNYPVGALYTKIKLPVDAGSNSTNCPKRGEAETVSILTLVATGDSSIQKAAQNGNITKINYVDWDVENFLGIVGTYTTIVCGE